MPIDSSTPQPNRPLTASERNLTRWMLEHGTAAAKNFLPQLDCAEATGWRCKCGCASVKFKIEGHPEAPPGVRVLADFVFATGQELMGIFIYENAGILSGLEVVGYSGDAPSVLPHISDLRPIDPSLQRGASKTPARETDRVS